MFAAIALLALACGTPPAGGDAAPIEQPAPSETLRVDFGSVELGATAMQLVAVRNDGTRTAALLASEVAPPFALLDAPAEIAFGTTAEVAFEFVPTDEGPVVGQATLRLGARVIDVELQGTGVSPPPEFLEIEFSATAVGRSVTRRLRLPNELDLDVPVQLRAPAAPFSVQLPEAAAAGQTIEIAITFTPAEAGAYDDQTRIELGPRSFEISLRGEAVMSGGIACLGPIEPIEFGEICGGAVRAIEIANTCSDPVLLEGAWIEGDPGFFLDDRPERWIAPGSETLIQIEFQPVASGSARAELLLQGIDGSWMAELSGQGVPPRVHRESWVRPPARKVDVLVVADPSFRTTQIPYLDDNLEALADRLVTFAPPSYEVDLRYAVTSTRVAERDGCAGLGGALLPADGSGDQVITRETPGARDALLANLKAHRCATTGGGEGLEATVRAASNLLFRRPDARLLVVIVSAEDDTSVDEVTLYQDALVEIAGGPSQLFVEAIVGPELGCAFADPGTRYAALAGFSATGGVVTSICASDWYEGRASTGDLGPKIPFHLTHVPVELVRDGRLCDRDCDQDGTPDGEIAVFLDGEPVPSVKGNGARVWEYDEFANAVDFYPLFVPELGTEVEAEYWVPCDAQVE